MEKKIRKRISVCVCVYVWETCVQVKKQQLESDMEQQICSILGKKDIQAVYCHPAYVTYMQSTSCKMPSWMNHKLEIKFA